MSNTPNNTLGESDDHVEQSLYAKAKKIVPREVHGVFARLRMLSVFILLGAFYGTAWLQWDGQQLLLLDLPERKFHIFFWTFWPQDFFYLAMMLIIAALSLFFFTAIAGRLWCGFACPQTVWTEIFIWIERRIEGSRNRQLKLDKMPWNAEKIRVRGLKHLIWFLFALWTGFTFVGYFTPIRELAQEIIQLNTGPWESFWILFYAFATWGNAGFMREQVCIYMCPYARFQSAMIDKDTLIISYDEQRGEPRGGRKHGTDPKQQGLGSCLDCSICVQVCPTGIDIRDGLQYQCIGCAACIDACDDVMDKMGYEKGLVRYTTHNLLSNNDNSKPKILRPRIIVYGLVLLALSAGLIYSIATRVPVELDVIRDRNALYKETYDGMIENNYTLKLINMDKNDHVFELHTDKLEGAQIVLGNEPVKVPSGEVVNLAVRVKADPYKMADRAVPIDFVMQAQDDPTLKIVEDARFLGPFRD